jgi:hypothetical protein
LTEAPRRRFTRTFRTALWLGIGYLAVLILVVAFPTGRSATRVTTQPSATPRPASGPICGIDHDFDPKTGRCVSANTTPLPCVQGSNFDSKAGFCMPVAQKVAPAPTSDANVFPPGIVRDPRPPDLPGFGNNNDQSQYNPFSNDSGRP